MSNYPRHIPGFNYIGFHRYFLTFCTFERNEYFAASENVALVQSQIVRALDQTAFTLPAYCFMRDHLHLLTEGLREDSNLKAFVKLAKQYSGFYFRQATRTTLWQRYGYERTLRDEETTPDVVRYIIENPVRVNYVTDVRDYPFWGSQVCSREELLEFIQVADPVRKFRAG